MSSFYTYETNQTDVSTLISLTETRATERNLHTANPRDQYLKVVEEVGEIAAALARGDRHEIADGIGDTIVTLIIFAMQQDMNITDCLAQAYNEIKDRKGKMIDGVFIKESDLL